MVVSPTREQSKIDLGYCRGILESSPILSKLIAGITAGTITLSTGVMIECAAANYRSVRGRAIAVCLIDEAAFLPSTDSAQPDVELLNAITPALGRFPGGGTLLIGSTPYWMQGILHDGWKAYYGQDDPEVLVWQAGTRVLNPTFDQKTIDREIAKNPGPKTAEYMAIFRADVSDFISLAMLQKCLQPGVRERGYHSTLNYSAFLDPSGGGKDAFTLAICHRENDVIILDLIRERAGSPTAAAAQYAEILKAYGIRTVHGDHYAGDWPKESFAQHGILFLDAKENRSKLYTAFLALLLSEKVEILDHPKMLLQFQTLVQEVGKGGQDKINHADGAHDDVCNAVAGAMVMASKALAPIKHGMPFAAMRPRTMNPLDIPSVPVDASAYENPAAPHRPEYASSISGDDPLFAQARFLRKCGLVRG